MKKNLFALFLLLSLAYPTFAQVQNADLENWTYVYGSFSFPPFLAADSFHYWQPDSWTTSNYVTADPDLGANSLVTRDSTAFSGSLAARLYTDSFILTGSGANLQLVIPGFLVSGTFPVDLMDFLSNGGNINPMVLPGAGQPINNRMASISAYVKFAPVDGDSLLVWAVLKKGNELIAEAKISDTTNYTSYTRISKDFTYYSCTMPDTAIIFIASSNPDFSALLGGGNSGAHKGTTLEVDSITMTDLTGPFVFGPFANNDADSTAEATPVTIDVLANDTSCNTNTVLAIVDTPLHGTATINPDNTINYAPDSGFVGTDSFSYSIYDSTAYDTAWVTTNVYQEATGLAQLHTTTINIYPNPSNGNLAVDLPTNNGYTISIIDLTGRILATKAVTSTTTNFDLSNYSNRLYFVQVRDKNNGLLVTRKVNLQR